LVVIEDCAQAHGAMIGGRSVGSFGDAGAWSFCQDKIMTTGGEGGIVTCRDEGLRRAMWTYKDHGKDWDAVYGKEHAPGFRWIHESFGTNWRMMEIQATLGLIQLRRMPQWSARRSEIAERYASALSDFSDIVRVPEVPEGFKHAWYRFYAYLRPDAMSDGWSRERILQEAALCSVPLLQGTCSEVYREKAFEGTAWRPSRPLPAAAELGETSLMFLTHPTLTDADVDRVIDVTCATLAKAMR
jgi:dTDP-4-amino-4,6-dideoxygalactose transaminase